MAVHLGNDSAVRRQSWADRARDADGDVVAAAEHAGAHAGAAGVSAGVLLRLLAPSPRDPNAQRARTGGEGGGAAGDLTALHKPGREPVWHGRGPRSVAADPALTRLPIAAAPATLRSTIPERPPQASRLSAREGLREPMRASVPEAARIAIAAVRAQAAGPIAGGAVAGVVAGAAAASTSSIAQSQPQPALQPSGGWLGKFRHALQARSERAHHQAELRHAALAASSLLTPGVQGGLGLLQGMSRFSNYLHALAGSLRTPVPALQAAARDAAALEGVTSAVQQRFAAQAGDKQAFSALLQQAFGDKFDAAKAETIRQQALAGDFSWAPKVEVVSSQALADLSGTQGPGIAQGAYVQSSDTIYISRELLHADPAQAQRLLMEEMGHGLDARLNTSDALGDEGEIFGKLMHGDAISAPQMAAMRADNDQGVVMINGQAVAVEYGFFSKAFKAITGGIKKVAGAVTRGVVNLAKSAVTVATGLVTMDFDKVKDGLKDGVNAVKTSVKAVHQAVKETAKELHRITKQAFQKLMQSKLFAAVLMICRFIPIPIVALVVHVIDLARAAYMVYQGIKHKSLSAVLGGVASLVGGAGNVAGAFGASAATVNTIANVANAASKLSMAYDAVANKDIGSALGLLGGAVGGPGASAGMNTLASATGYAQQALNIRDAVRNRDALAALGGTLGLAAGATDDSATRQNLSTAQEVVTGLRAAREIGRGNLDAAQSMAQGMGSAQAVSDDFKAGVQQRLREAEAADNRTLLNAADRELRGAPAEQDGAVIAPATTLAPPFALNDNGSGLDAQTDANEAPRTVRAGDYKGSLERIARDRLGPNASTREINDYVGQLFEINGIWAARRIGAERSIVLPNDSTPAATDGLRLYGADIQQGEQIKAERADARERDIERIRAFVNRDDPELRAQIAAQFALGKQTVSEQQAVAAPRETLTGNYDTFVLAPWKEFQSNTLQNLDNAAVSDGGGFVTGTASVVRPVSSIGFSLLDAGLGLGRSMAATYDSYERGTLYEDAKANLYEPAVEFGKAALNSDTFRVSVGGKFPNDANDWRGDDWKLMLGTDRVGFQFKKEFGVNLPLDNRLGIADTVARFSYNWNSGLQEELLVEKNFLKVPLLRTTAVGGVPLSLDVVPGARFNVTGNRQITPSLNVDLNLDMQLFKGKVSFELRKSGS